MSEWEQKWKLVVNKYDSMCSLHIQRIFIYCWNNENVDIEFSAKSIVVIP
jgi:hypothetical protein